MPLQGWRSSDKRAKYVTSGNGQTDFYEVLNFSNSDIGELCSHIQGITKRLKFPKNVLYFVYGYKHYVPVSRPCTECDLKG